MTNRRIRRGAVLLAAITLAGIYAPAVPAASAATVQAAAATTPVYLDTHYSPTATGPWEEFDLIND